MRYHQARLRGYPGETKVRRSDIQFGMLPLALGIGSGAEMLQPLAIAVIGGASISVILSLLVTP